MKDKPKIILVCLQEATNPVSVTHTQLARLEQAAHSTETRHPSVISELPLAGVPLVSLAPRLSRHVSFRLRWLLLQLTRSHVS